MATVGPELPGGGSKSRKLEMAVLMKVGAKAGDLLREAFLHWQIRVHPKLAGRLVLWIIHIKLLFEISLVSNCRQRNQQVPLSDPKTLFPAFLSRTTIWSPTPTSF